MTAPKTRVTVTVDPHLVEAGNEAVALRRAPSLSAWVNRALAERAAKDRRLGALGEAIADFETEFGVLTPEELALQERADRASARVVRGKPKRPAKSSRRRGAA